jgi:hypothetical protein
MHGEDSGQNKAESVTPAAFPMLPTGKKGGVATGMPTGGTEEIAYRFPYGRAAIEPVPDISGTFAVRLVWNRGKALIPFFESTALRPIAQVALNGQKFPVFLSQHGRKRRDRIVLAGKRKTARSARCALRFIAIIEGREDRLTWLWRVGATAPAMANVPPAGEETPPDEVTLFLPLAPGRSHILHAPAERQALAVWMNDLVVSIRVSAAEGVKEGYTPTPELTATPRGVQVTLRNTDLGGHGVSLAWETWVSPARTEAEARAALLRHLAESADRSQEAEPAEPGLLLQIGARTEAALMEEKRIAKRGADRQAYRIEAANGNSGSTVQAVGESVEAALLSNALLTRYYQSGDDALRRRARLISRGVCDFQVALEESPHWGAVWDAQKQAGKVKDYVDVRGGKTLSVAATARTAKGLHIAHAHFGTEILQRTALAASQWLLLKLDVDARIEAERFSEEGPPAPEDGDASPWVVAEALIPFVETFRATRNEVFLKAALRIVNGLKEGLALSDFRVDDAPAEYLASAVEGVLLVSREYENPDLIALAKQIAVGLRARRALDGSLVEPPGIRLSSPLAPTLAAARAALALTRVDDDPLWPLMAYRALRAAERSAVADASRVTLADQGALCSLSTGVLLSIAARARGCTPDRDRATVTRGWQTFTPDAATREYIQVTAPDGTPVDYLALVCQVSLQVLIAVLAPPTVTHVRVVKNKKTPLLKHLLTGDMDSTATLIPLGDGAGANIGVFLADT